MAYVCIFLGWLARESLLTTPHGGLILSTDRVVSCRNHHVDHHQGNQDRSSGQPVSHRQSGQPLLVSSVEILDETVCLRIRCIVVLLGNRSTFKTLDNSIVMLVLCSMESAGSQHGWGG